MERERADLTCLDMSGHGRCQHVDVRDDIVSYGRSERRGQTLTQSHYHSIARSR